MSIKEGFMQEKRVQNIRRVFIAAAASFAGAVYGGVSAYSLLPGDFFYVLVRTIRAGVLCLIIAIAVLFAVSQFGPIISEIGKMDFDDDPLKDDNRRWFHS